MKLDLCNEDGDVDCIQPIMDGSTNLRNGSVAEDGGAGGIGADPEEVAVVVKEEIADFVIVGMQFPTWNSCLH